HLLKYACRAAKFGLSASIAWRQSVWWGMNSTRTSKLARPGVPVVKVSGRVFVESLWQLQTTHMVVVTAAATAQPKRREPPGAKRRWDTKPAAVKVQLNILSEAATRARGDNMNKRVSEGEFQIFTH